MTAHAGTTYASLERNNIRHRERMLATRHSLRQLLATLALAAQLAATSGAATDAQQVSPSGAEVAIFDARACALHLATPPSL